MEDLGLLQNFHPLALPFQSSFFLRSYCPQRACTFDRLCSEEWVPCKGMEVRVFIHLAYLMNPDRKERGSNLFQSCSGGLLADDAVHSLLDFCQPRKSLAVQAVWELIRMLEAGNKACCWGLLRHQLGEDLFASCHMSKHSSAHVGGLVHNRPLVVVLRRVFRS